MQAPNTKRVSTHVTGCTEIACMSTTLDATEARAAKTRMWPTLRRARSANEVPNKKPAKYAAMITPVTNDRKPASSLLTPSNEPLSPLPTIIKASPTNSAHVPAAIALRLFGEPPACERLVDELGECGAGGALVTVSAIVAVARR